MFIHTNGMASPMKKAFAIMMLILPMLAVGQSQAQSNSPETMTPITITAGGKVFHAKLHDNEAASALLKQMPLTLKMSDLNRNEKYYKLEKSLPAPTTEKPSTIKAGELMVWSGDTLVLFYKTFSNSYGGYVRLGYVEDASSLANALGSGDAQVSFHIVGR